MSAVSNFGFSIGGLRYQVTVLPDRQRGGYSAKLSANGIGTIMEPNGTSPSDALTRLARELHAGDTTDRAIAKELVRYAWFPLKLTGKAAVHSTKVQKGPSWKQIADGYKLRAKSAKAAGGKVKRYPDGSILILPVEGAENEYFYQDWQADQLIEETKRREKEVLEHISIEDLLLAQSQEW